MCQNNRTFRIAVAAASLFSAIILAPATHASQLSNEGWQQLQGPRAGKAAISPTLLAANTPSVVAASPVASAPAVSRVTPTAGAVFRLVKGQALQQQIENWADRAGWTVEWNVPDGWIVPGGKDYGSDFESAVKRVIEELANNGADVVGDSWRGNRTVIISQNGMVQ
ncbi:hypothetical protein Tamer19_13700 [Cupriavidus sp. TA19]|uniref:toxin co-regulated pilus biosynthesis Q family protein n=1 Tax=unclassified Cupriavidus TaxID=2640874 RepID=UPI00272941F6|nr:toxin co-regulated pilus biosynthesis Q family protein [Cupriavidus sp. TA19]GLC91962.1 hypothetical protein Tamer19_13700 [Cupriavidus sp. TA19]